MGKGCGIALGFQNCTFVTLKKLKIGKKEISLADQSKCKIQSKFSVKLVKTSSQRPQNTVLTILGLLGGVKYQHITFPKMTVMASNKKTETASIHGELCSVP